LHGVRVRPSCLVITLLAASTATLAAQRSPRDYPQWRGRDRDGSASAFAEPKSWPDHLTRRWKVGVGDGYATPIVVGNSVFAFTRRDGNEVMAALDAATGKEIWKTAYPAPYTLISAAAAHGMGPKSTPLFYNGELYSVGNSGIVSAFEAATGRLVWQKPAPSNQDTYGASVSPVADGDVVIVHAGDAGKLTALDAKTGDVRWRWDGDSPAYASPIVVDLGGTRQVVSVTDRYVVGLSRTDGTLLWQRPSPRLMHISPILHEDTIIVSGRRDGISAFKPIKRDGFWTTEVVWETKEVSIFLSNPVLVDDLLFGLSERASGQFFALDAKTGKVLWLGQPRQATNTAVVKAGRLLFLLNDNGELIVARASTSGLEFVKQYVVSESATWAQPAISGNRVFVKDVSSLTLWTVN
jgi:outer membrane protein assembly factor BamB